MSESISLIGAVHELRRLHDTDVRAAITKTIEILATGQIPPAEGIIDGARTKLDPRWWWAGAINYLNLVPTERSRRACPGDGRRHRRNVPERLRPKATLGIR